ncbi:MAG TPA: uroporphyrinogen decarboxylase family protein [Candidatus Hydrogenedentes bacterium]|nr:uroporphyrinogen decarboxylase family protein [Candidatus Hydrogenedentota bacterium]HPG67915.1 uroporphyrinogen decarboxylase family protein [Candidatus Hydrogenedentota bacterium]
MTHEQWERLKGLIDGEALEPLPVGFIIDSPWLPNWAGMSIMDYYASDEKWFEANLRAVDRFPNVWFLPGFWAEWGMCTEPSAFGARCIWHENEFPFAEKVSDNLDDLLKRRRPNPHSDGLPPYVIKRMQLAEARLTAVGHPPRFAVARGPLNIAGFLMGNTEFLMAMKMDPDKTHAFLDRITEFLVHWIQVQTKACRSMDGVFILDDIVGFCGVEDFDAFAKPYLSRVFTAVDASVRFFHNDAPGLVCAPHLADIGVNLFNFSHDHPMAEMRRLTGDRVALLGNIPPRDVLASGTPEDVRAAVDMLLAALDDRRRVILSCGGGMPPGVSTENIEAFLDAASVSSCSHGRETETDRARVDAGRFETGAADSQ